VEETSYDERQTDTIIPNSKSGEDYVLPNEQSCYALVEEVLNVI